MKTKRPAIRDIFGHPGIGKTRLQRMARKLRLSKVNPNDVRGFMWGYVGMGKSEFALTK